MKMLTVTVLKIFELITLLLFNIYMNLGSGYKHGHLIHCIQFSCLNKKK